MSDGRIRAGRMVLAFLLAAGIGVAGCGDDDNGSPTSPSPSSQGATATISNNHGHVAALTGAQVSAGRAITLDIRGTADHSHTLDLTNDDVVRLQTRQRVDKDATANNSHTHRVTFN
jgi:hypothetical protein